LKRTFLNNGFVAKLNKIKKKNQLFQVYIKNFGNQLIMYKKPAVAKAMAVTRVLHELGVGIARRSPPQ
jgi:hypothetical protein